MSETFLCDSDFSYFLSSFLQQANHWNWRSWRSFSSFSWSVAIAISVKRQHKHQFLFFFCSVLHSTISIINSFVVCCFSTISIDHIQITNQWKNPRHQSGITGSASLKCRHMGGKKFDENNGWCDMMLSTILVQRKILFIRWLLLLALPFFLNNGERSEADTHHTSERSGSLTLIDFIIFLSLNP